MSLPEIYHPTDRPNFTIVRVDGKVFWFSYQTCIAFQDGGYMAVCENVWSRTTGKHLNHIDPDKASRLPHAEFVRRLKEVFEPVVLPELV
jgi:hypothetical protein